MTNIPRNWDSAEYQDVETQNYLSRVRAAHHNDPLAIERALDGISQVSRDHARTPVQWDDSPYAGFTSCKRGPWMRVNDNYTEINAKAQQGVRGSPLEFWREMIKLRKEKLDCFVHGRFVLFEPEEEKTVTFGKVGKGGERVLVVLNFSGKEQAWRVPRGWKVGGFLVGNVEADKREEEVLKAWEGRVYAAEGVEGVQMHGANGTKDADGHAVNGHA